MSRTEKAEFSQAKKAGGGFAILGDTEHTVGAHVPLKERKAAEEREERAASFVGRQIRLPEEDRYQILDMLGLVPAAKRVAGRG